MIKKKINVCTMTHHTVPNFGAVLQAYALQKALEKLSVDSEILNYKSIRVEKNYYRSFKLCQTVKDKIKYFLFFFQRKRYKKFDNFVSTHLKISREYTKEDLPMAEDKYDLFIAGSDQVWNLNIHNGDTSYMLDFVKDNSKKGSYAASFGYMEIPSIYKDISYNLLKQFTYLLVREKTGIDIINQLNINTHTYQVLDPTLLLTKDDYLPFVKSKVKTKYILLYDLICSNELKEFAFKLSKETKLDVISINSSFQRIKGAKNIFSAGPDEFIDLIAKSEYVVTSSFHGIIFSMIFNKNFYFGLNKEKINNNSRIIDLANKFGFSDRNIEYFSEIKDIEYNPINMKIEKERKKSIDLLMGMINDRERLVNESESNT